MIIDEEFFCIVGYLIILAGLLSTNLWALSVGALFMLIASIPKLMKLINRP